MDGWPSITESPVGPHQATPSELRDRLAAERRGVPFVLYRDQEGVQRIVELADTAPRRTFGRSRLGKLRIRASLQRWMRRRDRGQRGPFAGRYSMLAGRPRIFSNARLAAMVGSTGVAWCSMTVPPQGCTGVSGG